MVDTTNKIIIYCDGACSGNQFENNVEGWGAILIFKNKKKEIFGGEKNTTNQRMELTACIKALEQLKSKHYSIEIYSDSAYLINCINHAWYKKWEKNGWKNSKKEPVENRDLWETLLELINDYNPKFIKVEGHSGIALNEMVDKLAQLGIKQQIAK
jgi:ribonuclease HI